LVGTTSALAGSSEKGWGLFADRLPPPEPAAFAPSIPNSRVQTSNLQKKWALKAEDARLQGAPSSRGISWTEAATGTHLPRSDVLTDGLQLGSTCELQRAMSASRGTTTVT
jgi:hypothetical protein